MSDTTTWQDETVQALKKGYEEQLAALKAGAK
jgi:hypothetical protein